MHTEQLNTGHFLPEASSRIRLKSGGYPFCNPRFEAHPAPKPWMVTKRVTTISDHFPLVTKPSNSHL
jgi:hypothetical protein